MADLPRMQSQAFAHFQPNVRQRRFASPATSSIIGVEGVYRQVFKSSDRTASFEKKAEVQPSLLPPVQSLSEVSGKQLLGAAGLFGTGLLLHRLPVRTAPGTRFLLPTDWKVWTRVGLGILSAHKINKALNWLPTPWLGAIETVAVITPLTLGLSKKSLRQFLVMAPFVAGVVQGANFIHETIKKPLKESLNIPAAVSRLVLSMGLALLSVKVYPPLYKRLAKSGILGKEVQDQAKKSGQVVAGSAMVTCARGCTPGGVICLSEMGEIFGGMGHWFKSGGPA